MDADGNTDAVFTISTYPKNTSHPIVVLNGDGPVENIAKQVFPGGVLSVFMPNQMFFIDIDNDDREDLLISDAGLDRPPFLNPEAMIGIAMDRGDCLFEDVSATVPDAAKGLRNYSLAAGDLYNDGIVRIVLPSQAITGEDEDPPNHNGPEKSGLLYWNGYEFEYQQNWIDMSLWWWPGMLYASSFMSVQDIDNDGWQDLYLSGIWETPNHRVLYGHEHFPSGQEIITLPEGPYGHTTWDYFMQPDVDMANGTDVNKVVLHDFDGDGDLDIVSIMENVQWYKPGVFDDETHDDYDFISAEGGIIYGNVWFQVLRNEGERNLVEVVSQGRDMGFRYYISLLPVDIDLDGDTDLIGQYWNKINTGECKSVWGSTIFINTGNLEFQPIDAEDVFPELSEQAVQLPANSWVSDCATSGLGVLFPTVITPEGMKGLFVVPFDNKPILRVLRFQAAGQFQLPE